MANNLSKVVNIGLIFRPYKLKTKSSLMKISLFLAINVIKLSMTLLFFPGTERNNANLYMDILS
jgi:hypothetical protein